ncbi:MAG: tetraacyldisaccharide 4'-kinase [Candidatus Omnitrophica bacterium]|nr:tetraacyldisaccharide 4'-kinase [Candidatus Omnitrophota bacterium]
MDRIKKIYLEVIRKKKKYFILYGFLKALSFLYCMAVFMRNFLYQQRWIKPQRCKAFVVSVGNISWGGSGKTSLVIKLARYFNRSLSIAILRRGYGYDEESLLKESLPQKVRIFSGKDRLALARKAARKSKMVILDDGFQYRRLYRNLDIVLLNARQDLAAACLPAGPLREPLASIKRANIIVVREADSETRGVIINFIKGINPRACLYFASYQLKKFVDIKDGSPKSLEEAAVLTAIGWPQGFIALLERARIQIKESFIYPDHTLLSQKEWKRIERICKEKGIGNLVITAKDKARVYPSGLNIVVAEVELVIEAEKDFFSRIENELFRSYF